MAGYRVGVTGGIASGKSVVTRAFEALGVPVVDADVAAREAVAPGSQGLAELRAEFGDGILAPDGGLDRARMRERVFDDDAARQRLEAIIHPRVRRALREAADAAPDPYVAVAIPLLAEGGGRDAYPWLDRILVVDVPVDTQRQRLMARDGIDAALAGRMLAAQASRAQRLQLADDVLPNTGSLDALDPAIAALDRRYRHYAALKRASD